MSHRAPLGAQESARRLVPPLAAVAAVALVIVLLLFLNSPSHTSGAGPALTPPTVVPTTTASSRPTPTATPTVTRSHSPSPRPTRTVPVAPPSATATAAVAKAAVTVLNNSRRSGLAHRAAAQLRAGGWPIARIGNFTGRLAESTLYYAPGQAPAAEALARQFSAVQRVEPRFEGLPGAGLTLVVTRYWPA